MTCPSNPAKISATYADLLEWDPPSDSCADYKGPPAQTLPDGTTLPNACRAIAEDAAAMPRAFAPGSEARRTLIETSIYDRYYNTNYVASWYLVRSGLKLDGSGNVRSVKAGCTSAPPAGVTPDAMLRKSRHTTEGPLTIRFLDNSPISSSVIPLLGDAATVGILSAAMGDIPAGSPLAKSYTNGPVIATPAAGQTAMNTPVFAAGTSRTGANGWWAIWAKHALQDYRAFAPIHGGVCNLLFADGSVRTFRDANDDGFLNNGFPADPATGFTDATIELEKKDVASTYSLADRQAAQLP
jgi:prepilin-type processing-associated H-X9-DG protein